MKKIILFVLAGLVATSAASASTLQEQIAALQAQLAALQAQAGVTATTTSTGTATFTYTGGLIKVGSRGPQVKALQECLNRLGNNTGKVDGWFGKNTKAGVQSFQAAHGLVADGIIGPKTGPKFQEACVVTDTTTGTTTGDTTTGVTGDKIVVSGVASDDKLVGPAQRAVFAKVTLEAGDKDVKVKDLYVDASGSANTAVISNVVLLDSAMAELDTDGLDSDDEAKLKADFTVKAGETKTVYIAADMDANGVAPDTGTEITDNDGLDISLKVVRVKTDGADVEGLPIAGASHTVKDNVSVDNFTVVIENEGNAAPGKEVRIGEEDVKVATINVKANGDDQTVKSLKLTRTAAANKAGDDDLSHVTVKVDGKTYKATQDDDEYTFDFGDAIKLAEDGDDVDMVVYTDVEDGAGNSFKFDVKDIVVVDADMNVLSKTASTTSDTEEFKIALSKVAISKTTDVKSDSVSAGQDSANLVSFETEVTGKDVTGDVKVTVKLTGATAAADPKDIDLENVAIYTKSGSKVSDKEDTSFAAVADNTEAVITFDDVTFEEGDDAVDYVIKGDINKDAPTGTTYEVTKIEYVSVEDKDGEDIDDISETISGVAIDVESSAIAVSVEAADDTDLNTDKADQEVAKIKLDATNSGDDVKVSRIKISAVVADVSGTAAPYTKTVANSDLRNCELFDGNSSVSGKEDGGTSITFDVDVTVAKDTSKELSLRCDLNDKFENTDTVTVTGISFDAKGAETDKDLDTTFTTSKVATVTTGSMQLKASTSDDNDDKVVKDDADKVVLGDYEFKAKNADIVVDQAVVAITGDTHIDGNVELYVNGSFVKSEAAAATVTFTNLNKTVAKDAKIILTVKADAKDAGTIQVTSFNVKDENGTAATAVTTAPAVTVVAELPVITKVNVDSTNLSTANDVTLFAYKVKAEGGDVVLDKTLLTATLNNATLANAKIKVYDNSSMTGSAEKEVAFTSGSAATLGVTISENDTYYVFLVADVDVQADARSIRVQMNDDATGVTFTTPNLTGDKLMNGDMKSLLKKD